MEIFRTKRLIVRPLTPSDRENVCKVLQDPRAMYAFEHAFSDREVDEWMDKMFARYAQDGFGFWALIGRADGAYLGQGGLTMQPVGDRRVLEIGYQLIPAHWHNGYATEMAIGCRDYAFSVLGAPAVYSLVRENNVPSRRVAERAGMRPVGTVVKHYYGMDMPHIIYRIAREDCATVHTEEGQ